jgi:hypothetical protein
MDSEGLSNHRNKHLAVFCGILLIGVLVGCMEKPRVSVTQPPPVPVPAPAPPSVQEPDNAHVRAAAAMVRQGRQHLTQGEPDAAIRILERSVALDSSSGQNYYYLAEAWLMKENARHAREFNRLAGIRFAQDAVWQTRISRQRARIDEFEK